MIGDRYLLSILEEGSELWKEWEKFLGRIPYFKSNVTKRLLVVKQWNGSHPYDEEYEALYLEADIPLDAK